MKISFKSPLPGEKDDFSKTLANTEWIFKFVGWMIVIGTIRYAGETIGSITLNSLAAFLTLEVCALAMSFAKSRIHIQVVQLEGKRPFVRKALNIVFAGLVGFAALEGASYIVKNTVNEIVTFNKRSH